MTGAPPERPRDAARTGGMAIRPLATGTNVESNPVKSVRNINDAANDLAHIGTVVLHLEKLAQSRKTDWQSTIVTLPEYWRARVVANAAISPALEPQVRSLLARLEAIERLGEPRG
ncbi:hypothetical protein LJ656_22995 [Paraburkholderia sp. MMS20-SJTR3]|uniref:Uncharacterized protein n=1 Tax=Paraburkholderia sejongensis TaxID=2886946 RepID=A0ABS8K0J9_9BURK|nr:hypothetical protein [Paraburkholderia sp. MMS20-SJTR3]MCC8395458.1 hypothetical protein [Paraburkholderia sp. MMS20-SJTR3]